MIKVLVPAALISLAPLASAQPLEPAQCGSADWKKLQSAIRSYCKRHLTKGCRVVERSLADCQHSTDSACETGHRYNCVNVSVGREGTLEILNVVVDPKSLRSGSWEVALEAEGDHFVVERFDFIPYDDRL
jgi:hypothetical protein